MRFFALILTFVAACDHRPPKRQVPPAPGSASAAPVAVAPDAGAGSAGSAGSAAAVAQPPPDEACLQIGVKLSEIVIAATTDAQQKAAYEQERTKLVKRFSENCTREKWPDAVRTCFLAAKSPSEVEVCSRDLVKPAPPTPTPTPTPGSAAGSAGSAKVDPHAGHAH